MQSDNTSTFKTHTGELPDGAHLIVFTPTKALQFLVYHIIDNSKRFPEATIVDEIIRHEDKSITIKWREGEKPFVRTYFDFPYSIETPHSPY